MCVIYGFGTYNKNPDKLYQHDQGINLVLLNNNKYSKTWITYAVIKVILVWLVMTLVS